MSKSPSVADCRSSLPSVSASVDGGGVSTYMVTFSYFDGSGALQSASLVDFASLANNFSLYFGKSSEGSTNSGTVSVVGNSYQVVPGSSGSSFDFSKASMDALSVHYNMYGVEYFFTFYK